MNTPRKQMTLCLVYEHPRILLGLKKRGFGAGLWNGFGGKVTEGESLEEAAEREFFEETGMKAEAMEKCGIIEFDFVKVDKPIAVHIFKIIDASGEPVETEEMHPQWFSVDQIPFKDMWPEDAYWMPLFFKGAKFRGRILLDEPSTGSYKSKILKNVIEVVNKLD